MMIMADNNFLIKLIDDKQAYRVFNQALERKEVKLGLCTPVISEFLVKDNNRGRSDFLGKVNNFTQIFNFDLKSAQICANLFRDLMNEGYIKENKANRQVIKVDLQIIAITLANNISKLYTTDKEIIEIVAKLNLPIEIVNFENDEFQGMPLFEDKGN